MKCQLAPIVPKTALSKLIGVVLVTGRETGAITLETTPEIEVVMMMIVVVTALMIEIGHMTKTTHTIVTTVEEDQGTMMTLMDSIWTRITS